MSLKELNSYRFLSGQEPSDEMLGQLMHEVTVEVVARRQKADATYFSQMKLNVEIKRQKWEERIDSVTNV